MNKRWLLALLTISLTVSARSQTLFTYGKYKGDVKEFLRAFNKNNTPSGADRPHAIREYLDLYINSRLKIQEAHARGFDTLPQIRSEVETLRSQIVENYMSDPNAISRLQKEAFVRSQKDIHAGHLFVSFKQPSGLIDSAAAMAKLKEVTSRLDKGEDFQELAARLSDEPGAAFTRGDIGYITVFTLPYTYENIIYNTPPGKVSKPFTSKLGYHLFKNLGERKAAGKLKLQQILIAFPPGVDELTKQKSGRLADSLYQRLLAGDDFGKLATAFSNDYISAATGGNIPDVGVGQYDPEFEKYVWSLPEDGTVGKPLMTTHGYHLIKRIGSKPIVSDANDKAYQEEQKAKIMADDRWKTARDFIYDQVRKKPGIKRGNYEDRALWAISDSLLDGKPAGIGRSLNSKTILFTIDDTSYTVLHWIAYAQAYRYKPDRSGLKAYPDLMDEFSKSAMYEYFRSHLENYNEEFRSQMNEFRDGNLFFEIMQQEIWNRTQNDSNQLMTIYKKNRNKYNWKASAEAIVFFSSDEGAAKSLYEEVRKNPGSWKKLLEPWAERIVSDSSRYEWDQLPGLGNQTPVAGMLTQPVVNASDNTTSFALIAKVIPDPAPRSYTEAKGLVMNDYQAELETKWVQRLRKKYPVVVNKKVLDGIAK